MKARKYTLEQCPDELLLKWAAMRGFIKVPDDWNPSPAEIREHDTDPAPIDGMTPRTAIREELKRRGLQDRVSTPW